MDGVKQMLKLKVAAVRLFVRNFDLARAFYVDTLGFSTSSEKPAQGVLVLNDGNLDIVVERVSESDSPNDQALAGRFTGISLAVEDIADSHRQLVALGVRFSGEPEKQYWGGYLATFCDPDNNEIQLVQFNDTV